MGGIDRRLKGVSWMKRQIVWNRYVCCKSGEIVVNGRI